MKSIESSAIEAVHHDGDALIVQFRGGRQYRYPSAGAEHLDGLIGAESPGRYFAEHIRPHHDHER